MTLPDLEITRTPAGAIETYRMSAPLREPGSGWKVVVAEHDPYEWQEPSIELRGASVFTRRNNTPIDVIEISVHGTDDWRDGDGDIVYVALLRLVPISQETHNKGSRIYGYLGEPACADYRYYGPDRECHYTPRNPSGAPQPTERGDLPTRARLVVVDLTHEATLLG